MPFPNDRTYTFDKNLELADGAVPMTVTGFAQTGGANGVLDLGGNQGTTPKQQSRIDAVCVIDMTSIANNGTQTYKFMLLGSNDAGMATGNVCLGEVTVGAGASIDGINMATSPPVTAPATVGSGRYELLFTTNQAGLLYEFVALYVIIGGAASSAAFKAFVAVLPEP
jgi:hypothetical protein